MRCVRLRQRIAPAHVITPPLSVAPRDDRLLHGPSTYALGHPRTGTPGAGGSARIPLALPDHLAPGLRHRPEPLAHPTSGTTEPSEAQVKHTERLAELSTRWRELGAEHAKTTWADGGVRYFDWA